MSRGIPEGDRPDAGGEPRPGELKRHIAQLQSALADLEADPQNVHHQSVFRLAFAAVIALLPNSLYTGRTRVEAEPFSAEFVRLVRNKLVRDNALGIGDIFIRRALIEWELVGDDIILDELEGILSERKGHATRTMGALRERFGQSPAIHFAGETHSRFQVARLRQRVRRCEKTFDAKQVAEAKWALRDTSVARRAGPEWTERLNLLERVRDFQGALAVGGRREQREAFKELLNAAAVVKKAVGSSRYRDELQPNLCRVFLSGASQSLSQFVWLNCLHLLEALKYDLDQGIAQLDDLHRRLALVNRRYWFDRRQRTAATPMSYVQKYRDFFKDYELRLINPSVGFAAIGSEACLFTPQTPATADKEPSPDTDGPTEADVAP